MVQLPSTLCRCMFDASPHSPDAVVVQPGKNRDAQNDHLSMSSASESKSQEKVIQPDDVVACCWMVVFSVPLADVMV